MESNRKKHKIKIRNLYELSGTSKVSIAMSVLGLRLYLKKNGDPKSSRANMTSFNQDYGRHLVKLRSKWVSGMK